MSEQIWSFFGVAMPASAWTQMLLALTAIVIAIATPAYQHWSDSRRDRLIREHHRRSAWCLLAAVANQMGTSLGAFSRKAAGSNDERQIVFSSLSAVRSMCVNKKDMLSRIDFAMIGDEELIKYSMRIVDLIDTFLFDLVVVERMSKERDASHRGGLLPSEAEAIYLEKASRIHSERFIRELEFCKSYSGA